MSTSSPPAAGNSMRQQLDELDALLQRMLELPINQSEDNSPPPPEPPQPRRVVEQRPAPAVTVVPPQPAPAAAVRRPQPMVLLADSGPVAQPKTPPESWDQSWSINLNPQQGSSVLGPRSPAAGAVRPPAQEVAPAPAPPVWRAETVTYVPPAAPPIAPPRHPVQPVAMSSAASTVAEPTVTTRHMPPPRPTYRPTVPPRAPLVLRPLVGLNRAFDALVIRFGPPGRWLRSPLGRTALGVGGLLMLASGAAWGLLDWIGWTW